MAYTEFDKKGQSPPNNSKPRRQATTIKPLKPVEASPEELLNQNRIQHNKAIKNQNEIRQSHKKYDRVVKSVDDDSFLDDLDVAYGEDEE